MEETISDLKTGHIHCKLNRQKNEENLTGPKGVLGSRMSGSRIRGEIGREVIKEMIAVILQIQS